MSTISLQTGLPLPTSDYYEDAWASEPLGVALNGADWQFALPKASEDLSVLAKDSDKIVGQCSSITTRNYWTHYDTIDAGEQNTCTQVFLAITQKGVKAEKEYLDKLDQPIDRSLHSAGIAVLPEYRGLALGKKMRQRQIEIAKERQMTTLFCQTTNAYSAATVSHFDKVAEFPYQDLTREMSCPQLTQVNGCYTVWCLKV